MTNNRAFKARFVSLVLIIVLVLGLSSRYPLGALATVTGAAPIDLGVTYNFANFNAASAYGTVKLVPMRRLHTTYTGVTEKATN